MTGRLRCRPRTHSPFLSHKRSKASPSRQGRDVHLGTSVTGEGTAAGDRDDRSACRALRDRWRHLQDARATNDAGLADQTGIWSGPARHCFTPARRPLAGSPRLTRGLRFPLAEQPHDVLRSRADEDCPGSFHPRWRPSG
jgi:hypothetical protein